MTRRYTGETVRKRGGLNEGQVTIVWVTLVTEYCKEMINNSINNRDYVTGIGNGIIYVFHPHYASWSAYVHVSGRRTHFRKVRQTALKKWLVA